MSETKMVVTPHHELPRRLPSGRAPFRRHLPVVAATIILVALLLWYTAEVLLLVFTGVLLAIFLRGLSDALSQYTPLRGLSSLLVVVSMLLAILGIGVWLLTPQLTAQIGQLTETLPRSIQSLEQRLQQYGIGQWLLSQPPVFSQHMPEGNVLAKATRVFSTTFGALASLIVILVIGLYMAVSPSSYTEGIIHLVPIESRARAREVVQAVGQTLRWWLLGRWVSMIVVGLTDGIGHPARGIGVILATPLFAAMVVLVKMLYIEDTLGERK